MPVVNVNPPGAAIPKLEKAAIEQILYNLDCSSLLDKNELISSAEYLGTHDNLIVSGIRPRLGKSIEIKISNKPFTSSSYLDFPISILFNTTLGNQKLAQFQLRVYK